MFSSTHTIFNYTLNIVRHKMSRCNVTLPRTFPQRPFRRKRLFYLKISFRKREIEYVSPSSRIHPIPNPALGSCITIPNHRTVMPTLLLPLQHAPNCLSHYTFLVMGLHIAATSQKIAPSHYSSFLTVTSGIFHSALSLSEMDFA